MTTRIEALERLGRLRADIRASFFKRSSPGSTGKHSDASKFINESRTYDGKCVVCGTKKNVTKAHLIVNSLKLDYSCWNEPMYSTNFERLSPRNFLPLCGTLGEEGTCHHLFDSYQLAILFRPFDGTYHSHCFLADRLDLNKQIIIDDRAPPYRRALAWRTRECVNESSVKLTFDQQVEFLEGCNFMEDAASVAGDSSWR